MVATCPDHVTRTSNYLPISPAARRDKHPIRGMAVMLSLGQEGLSGSLIGANRKMQTAQDQKSVHHERVLHCSTTSSALCNAEERTQSSASLCNFNNLSAYDDKGTICSWKMSSMFPRYIHPSSSPHYRETKQAHMTSSPIWLLTHRSLSLFLSIDHTSNHFFPSLHYTSLASPSNGLQQETWRCLPLCSGHSYTVPSGSQRHNTH